MIRYLAAACSLNVHDVDVQPERILEESAWLYEEHGSVIVRIQRGSRVPEAQLTSHRPLV